MPKTKSARRERPLFPRNITGRRVQAIRLAAKPKVSQEDLAAKLTVRGLPMSQEQVAKIESGRRPVLDYELAMIAKALRVPVATFFETRKRG